MVAIEERALIAGRYRLERPLARGGMGSVWVARHVELDVPMAIKFMAASCAASLEARVRFAREARAAAHLRSPNVVQVHDYGVEQGTPYLVMELLQGEHLGARLKRVGRLGLPVVQGLVTQICKALRRAHDAGVVHRDLKPSNIFLARHDEDEVVKVLDFGIAKATGYGAPGEATKTGLIMGSPHYMSPEQARDSKRVDCRSDLWSLGVLAFRALTGEIPFQGDNLLDVLTSLASDPVPVPSGIAPHLGPEVDRFFERALTRDPAQRFQSANEMAEAFSALTEPHVRPSRTSLPPALSTGRAAELTTRVAPSVTVVRSNRTVSRPVAPAEIVGFVPVSWVSERAKMKLSLRASSVVVVEFSGHLCRKGVRCMIESVTPILAQGHPVDVFNDWEGMTGYDSEARVALSEWVIETAGFRSVNILVRSKLVAMGVAVANLAVGGTIVSYTSRATWQAGMDGTVSKDRADGLCRVAK